MKAYAQSTPGVACASFGYDPETYEPTYQLAMGVAGRSLALEMAERLGLPAAALADARSRAGRARGAGRSAAQEAGGRHGARCAARRSEIAAERAAVDEDREPRSSRSRARSRRPQAPRADRLQEGPAEARRGRRRARPPTPSTPRSSAWRRASRRPPPPAPARAPRPSARFAKRRKKRWPFPVLLSWRQKPAAAVPLVVGGRARVTSLGVIGEVMSLARRRPVEIAVSGKRLVVPRSEVLGGGRPRALRRNDACPRQRPRVQQGQAAAARSISWA